MARAQFNYKIANGSGSLILKNCKKSLFKRFEIHGKSEQVITKGLQLLDIAKIPTPQAGLSYYNMQVEEGKYTLSTKYRRANQRDLFLFAGEVDTGASSDVNGVDSTISRTVESINGYITIGYRKGEYGVNPFDFETMLNKGDTPLPYEPYTGGKPSPSQEYPQEIVSVGKKGKNLFDISKVKSSMDVEVAGKNLVPPKLDFVPFGNNDPQKIEFDPKTNSYNLITRPDNFNQVTCYVRFSLRKGTYVISRKIQIDGVNIEQPYGLQVYYADTNKLLYHQERGIFRKFTLKEDTNVLINLGHFTEKKQKEAIIYEVQLEKSDVPTPYEPYHEPQTVKIQLDEPLRGIGQYKDIVTKKGVLRNILEANISDNLQNVIYGSQGAKYIFSSIKNADLRYDRTRCMSNVGFASNQNRIEYTPIPYTSDFLIQVADDDTVETVKEKTKNITVAYVTKTPIFEPFPPEIQTKLSSLYTNEGTTVVTIDGGEVQPDIEVEYAAEKEKLAYIQSTGEFLYETEVIE